MSTVRAHIRQTKHGKVKVRAHTRGKKKRGSFMQKASDIAKGMPRSLHPVISALQFVAQHAKTGGASMNVHSGNLLVPKTRGYAVGGEPDRRGRAIPASTYLLV